MRGENTSINIQNNSTGKVKRVKRFKADCLVANGSWSFISNTIYKEATRSKNEKKKVN